MALAGRRGRPAAGAGTGDGLPEPPLEGFVAAIDAAARWLARELDRAVPGHGCGGAAAGGRRDSALHAVAFHERGRDDWPLCRGRLPAGGVPGHGPRARQSGEALRLPRRRPLADPAEIREVRRDGFRSMMIVPIRAGTRPIGSMEIFDARACTFASDERRLAVGLGRHAALLLEGLPR